MTTVADRSSAELRESRTTAVSLRRLDRVVELDVANAVLVAEAGATIAHCRDVARAANLWCPSLRWLRPNETIGAAVAAGHGRRSRRFGTTADYLLGVRFACPAVGLARHGGKAIKNATGYNLSGIVAGSRGELGVVLEVILRLVPMSAGRVVQLYRIDEPRRLWEVGRSLARVQTSAADDPTDTARPDASAIECWTSFAEREGLILFESEHGFADRSGSRRDAPPFPGLELIPTLTEALPWPPALSGQERVCLRAALNPNGIDERISRIVAVARDSSLAGSVVAELTGGAVELGFEDPDYRSAAELRTILGLPKLSANGRDLRSTLKSAFDPRGQLRSHGW